MAGGAGVAMTMENDLASAEVMAHGDRLAQVFINVISNAIRHNDNPMPRVWIRAAVSEDSFVVEIEDNGPGIAAADRERIFSKFSRTSSSAPSATAGAGLGLSISRAILKRMCGDLELVAKPGSGACFRVTLPLLRAVGETQIERAALAGE
jgi:signal transduction histidine kinase